MKAVLCTEWGGPGKLSVGDTDPPSPAAGEVVIDVKAAGVNFADTLIIQGTYQLRPDFPFIPGLEVAGTVQQRVSVPDDIDVDHDRSVSRIERLHVRARAQQPELFHVEEDDVDRPLQGRVPEGLRHAQQHEHPGPVVDQTVAKSAVVQTIGIEVSTDDNPRRTGTETDHHVLAVGPSLVRTTSRKGLQRVGQLPSSQLLLEHGKPQIVRRLHESPRDSDHVVRERRRHRGPSCGHRFLLGACPAARNEEGEGQDEASERDTAGNHASLHSATPDKGCNRHRYCDGCT